MTAGDALIGFCENLRVRIIIINNFETNLSFQLYICNSLFENAAPNNVLETSGLSPIYYSDSLFTK